jgi:HSP20 family protein
MAYSMTTRTPIFGLRRELDRLLEDTFARDGNTFLPAVDIKETDNEIRMDLELPGMRPEDVEVTAENGLLTIRGEKRSERQDEEGRYHVVERVYGTFLRTFTLPQGVDESQIQAEFNNGILSIRIPKAAIPQPRRIEVGEGQGRQQAAVGSGNMSGQNQQWSDQNQQRADQNQQRTDQNQQRTDQNQQRSEQQYAGQQSGGQQSGGQQSSGGQSSGRSPGRQSSGTSQRDRENEQMAAQGTGQNR